MSDIYLNRLIALRDIGFPLAAQKEQQGALDFRLFMSHDRTCGCLLGWWATTDYAKADGWHFQDNVPSWNNLPTTIQSVQCYFNLGAHDWLMLFEDESEITLADRKAHLQKLIEEFK